MEPHQCWGRTVQMRFSQCPPGYPCSVAILHSGGRSASTLPLLALAEWWSGYLPAPVMVTHE